MHTMATQVEGLALWDTSAVCGLTQLARANQSSEDHNSVPGVFRLRHGGGLVARSRKT